MSRLWSEKDNRHYEDESIHAGKAIARIMRRVNDGVNVPVMVPVAHMNRRRRRRLGISLATVFIAMAGAWIWMQRSPGAREAGDFQPDPIVANNGSRSRSLLPDGTTVWLNAGSRLYYVNDFNGTTREVKLEGEAFFDVVKQPARPFIVHTAGINITVLGTAFNVKAYPEDKNIETTLYRGLVQVSRQENAKEVIDLRPNEKLILAKEAAKKDAGLSYKEAPTIPATADFIKTHIDSTKTESERFETAWLYSRLEFRGSNFETLAHQLERWYNVTIVFADEEVKHLNFNGSFEKENIEQAFQALRIAVPVFDYKIENHQVVVSTAHHLRDAVTR